MSNLFNKSIIDPVPPLSVIMAQHTMIGGNGMRKFLDDIPPETLATLKQYISSGNKNQALLMACNYVVKFYTYVPMDVCLSHGEFVYELLKLAKKS